MKILVVDDDANIRALSERVLVAAGHVVAVCATGDEAALWLNTGWDLVLTDVQMPGAVDGLELLRRVKDAGTTDVVMMTGSTELTVAVEALKRGAYDFLLKPFSPDVLKAAVERCENKRALSVELAREKALRAELARMQQVKDLFGLFVTPEVAEHVLSLPPEKRRAGTRRTVTMLFADVRRFTPYAESVEPELAVETLNAVLAVLIGAIRREGGMLNKFMGDGLLAIFGAPLDLKDHEKAAARAALRAMAGIRELAREREAAKLPPLHVGIGINTGPVVAGCLGTNERAEYTVIGHAVNLAARLEEAAGPGQILLGPATAAALDGAFVCKTGPAISLPGVAAPIVVSELFDERRNEGEEDSASRKA